MDTLKFKLVIAYDGTNYAGWQVQKMASACSSASRRRCGNYFQTRAVCTVPAGRTRASMRWEWWRMWRCRARNSRWPPAKLALALNAHLPEDIRVMSARQCAAAFHARFDAAGKQYRYFVWNHTAMNPLLRQQAWQVPKKLDVTAIRLAVRYFLGRHDFKSLAENAGLQGEVHHPNFDALRPQTQRAIADVHHRRRWIFVQNVPGHRGDGGAGGSGEIRTGGNQAHPGGQGPSAGGNDRAGARTCFVESVLQIEAEENSHAEMNIVLVEPEIPPNTGNVARLCAATKTKLHLIEPFGFRLDDRELKRAGMDYWEQVKWHRWPDWINFKKRCRKTRGCGLWNQTGQGCIQTFPMRRGLPGVRAGNGGLPAVMLEENRGRWVRIPMFNPESRSLNLSNCAAIVLFEALRQQGFGGEL